MPVSQVQRKLEEIDQVHWFHLERNSLNQVELVNNSHPDEERILISHVKEQCACAMNDETVTIYSGKFIESDGKNDFFIGDLIFSTVNVAGGDEEFGAVMKLIGAYNYEGCFSAFISWPRSKKLAFLGY